MAVELTVYIRDPGDGMVKVKHTFYGDDEAEAETYRNEHLASCSYFRSADAAGNTLEEIEEIDDDELPDWEELNAEDEEEGDEDAEEEPEEE